MSPLYDIDSSIQVSARMLNLIECNHLDRHQCLTLRRCFPYKDVSIQLIEQTFSAQVRFNTEDVDDLIIPLDTLPSYIRLTSRIGEVDILKIENEMIDISIKT
jgi:hypothetical protein